MIILRQLIFALLALTAGAFLVLGPRPSASVPTDRVVVEYWEKWVGLEADAMRRVVDDFNDSVGLQKHIYVRYLSMSKLDQKLLVATAAGVPPDIAGLWDPQTAEFAELGLLQPLDQLAIDHGIDAGTYKDVYWKACHYDGHLWTLVSTPAVVALHYNKRIFHDNAVKLRRAGLDPDRPPQTLDELDRYGRALETFDAHGRLDRAGYLPMEPGWYLDFTYAWFGGELFDPVTRKFTLDTPENIAAFKWIQSYSRRLGREASVEFHDAAGGFDSPQNPFLLGKLAMEQQGPWMANYIDHLTRKRPWSASMGEALVPREQELTLKDRRDNYEWAAAPFPSAVPGQHDVSFVSFDSLAIPRGARHPREAFEFMAYVTRQEVMEKLNTVHCKNSPLRKVSAEFVARHPNPYIEVFDRLAASANARFTPQVPMWAELKKELDNAVQGAGHPDRDVRQILLEAQGRLQAKLDRQDQVRRERAAANGKPEGAYCHR